MDIYATLAPLWVQFLLFSSSSIFRLLLHIPCIHRNLILLLEFTLHFSFICSSFYLTRKKNSIRIKKKNTKYNRFITWFSANSCCSFKLISACVKGKCALFTLESFICCYKTRINKNKEEERKKTKKKEINECVRIPDLKMQWI